MLKRLEFNGNAYVGIYCRTNNQFAFVQPTLPSKIAELIKSILKVDLIKVTIEGSNLIGPLVALNSNGIIITNFIDDNELDLIKKQFDGEIYIIDDKFNAAGNNILANDNGAIIHPMINEKTIKKIEGTLGVDTIQSTIAELNTVGTAGIATNKGLLCHPKITEKEQNMIEKIMNVEIKKGTVNHGMPYIGAGLVANSNGAIAGSTTTGVELNRIEDTLYLIGD